MAGSVQGTQGVQGRQGVQGFANQGIQGMAGTAQGTQGVQGRQGVQGLQGFANQGIQGMAGTAQGTQGTQGLQGTQGRQGVQGLSIQGIQGMGGSAQGTQGTQGLQGLQGSSADAALWYAYDDTRITVNQGITTVASETIPANTFKENAKLTFLLNLSARGIVPVDSPLTYVLIYKLNGVEIFRDFPRNHTAVTNPARLNYASTITRISLLSSVINTDLEYYPVSSNAIPPGGIHLQPGGNVFASPDWTLPVTFTAEVSTNANVPGLTNMVKLWDHTSTTSNNISLVGPRGLQGASGPYGAGQYSWVIPNFNIAINSLNGNTIKKISGGNNWVNSKAYSAQSYARGAYLTCKTTTFASELMFGLNSNPNTNTGNPFSDIDYGIHINGAGTAFVYVNGINVANTAYDTNTVFYIIYDGINVRYWAVDSTDPNNYDDFGGYISTRAIGAPLYFDSYFYTLNGELNNIGFGPAGERGTPFTSVSAVGEGFSSYVSNETLVLSISGQDPVKNKFTANGLTNTFLLTGANSSNVNNYRVDIDGVLQEPGDDYIVSGGAVILSEAPLSGSKIVVVANNLRPLAESASDQPKGGTNNRVFFENDIIVTQNYAITTGKNAMTAGPITILDGRTVTVPDGSTWTVV
jgi:hypothetical protein